MLARVPTPRSSALLAALCLASASPGYAEAPPRRSDGLWIRTSRPDGSLIWGRKDGIVFGLPSPGGLPGPRGLIRLAIVRDGAARPDLVNFLALEPVVRGRKAFSELERSQLDNVQGKRLSISGPVEGVLEVRESRASKDGARGAVEDLVVKVLCEPFENGALVRAELRIASDRPEELRVALWAAEGSAPIEENTVTATMGNYGRLRRVTLKGRWLDSRELFEGYQGDGFVDRPPFPLEALPRVEGGDILVAAVTDEKDPASVKIDGARVWQYRTIPLTQYCRVEARDVEPGLRLQLNGRRVYWQTRREIPGGIAFENFEIRSRFKPGQTFIFGLSRKSPADLGVDPDRPLGAPGPR